MKKSLALLAAGIVLSAGAAEAARLEVIVTGVRNNRGDIRVAVCEKPDFPDKTCRFRAIAPARSGSVTLRFDDVPPGEYAASVFHDEARSGKLEFSLFGTPRQGVGFSRDARMKYGPPSFADAAIRLTEAGGSIAVPLHYPE